MQRTQFYFNHYPAGVTFSVWAGTVLDSQQVPKSLKIQVLVRTLAPFPPPEYLFPPSGWNPNFEMWLGLALVMPDSGFFPVGGISLQWLQHSNFLLSPLATIFHAAQIATINSVINGRTTGSNQLISGNVLEKRDFLNNNNNKNVAKWSAAPERLNVLLVQAHHDKWCHCVWHHCATTVRYPIPTAQAILECRTGQESRQRQRDSKNEPAD